MKKIFFKIYQSSLVKNALKAMQFLVYQLGLDSLLAKNGEKKWAFFLLPTHKFYEKHAPIRWQRNGIAYELDRKDYHQWQIFAKTKEVGHHTLAQFFKDNTVFLDCGANVGFITLELAKFASDKGLKNTKIYSFEPNPPIFNALSKNVSLNPVLAKTITPVNLGLGQEKSTHTFFHNTLASGASNGFEGNADTIETTIQIDSLDNFVDSYQLEKVDVMKIDIEGFEPFLFLGGGKTIARFKPVILMEINDETQNHPIYGKAFIYDFLRKNNYELYVEEKPGHRILFDEKVYRNEYYHLIDLLAIPK